MKETIPIFNPEKKDLQEKINEISNLEIGSIQRAELILILLDLKPATEVTVYNWNESADVVKNVISNANLLYKEKQNDDDRISADLTVSKSEENIEELYLLSAREDDIEYGRLMGFPDTATNAYITNELLDLDDPRSTSFFAMRLSKDNWQEELAVLQSWEDAIQKYAPELYEELSNINNDISNTI